MRTRRALLQTAPGISLALLTGCGTDRDTRPTGGGLGVVPPEGALVQAMYVIKALTAAGYATAYIAMDSGPRRRTVARLFDVEARHLRELRMLVKRLGLPLPSPSAPSPSFAQLPALERDAVAGWSWLVPRAISKELRVAAAIMLPVDMQQAVVLESLAKDSTRSTPSPTPASPLQILKRLAAT